MLTTFVAIGIMAVIGLPTLAVVALSQQKEFEDGVNGTIEDVFADEEAARAEAMANHPAGKGRA